MKYSIITPVYNRADCISRCIESVVRNEKRKDEYEIEHIIVDDGSSDDTVKIVSSYAKRYDWIKFIPFAHNRGTNAARNAAISVATGDFSIILDSDDYFVEKVDAIYLSEEYIEELAYNSKSNVFFGFTLADLEAEFQGTRYVFTLGDDGKYYYNSKISKANVANKISIFDTITINNSNAEGKDLQIVVYVDVVQANQLGLNKLSAIGYALPSTFTSLV